MSPPWPPWSRLVLLGCLAAGLNENHRSASRANIPRREYTYSVAPQAEANVQFIGRVRSPYRERFGTPRQPTVTENVLGGCEQDGVIELFEGHAYEEALADLKGFAFCWVVSWIHLNGRGWTPRVRPPRQVNASEPKRRGLFATRAPHRPNPIGLSALRIVSVDAAAREVTVRGLDLLDGTPVLDIKPYVPFCDAFPLARAGWLDELPGEPSGPSDLGYSPPPPHLRPPK